uniref:Uncharacterized protein n=1 Tax=Tanacetum cinerariifolium TaxID=118510 RepID=A0A6L2J3B4_TANCI|nr:hypothetical protein [Tanacetum cinerariifolium]
MKKTRILTKVYGATPSTSIAGGLDAVNLVIRLPIERGINSDTLEDPSKDQLVPIAISPFHDDQYMKVMQAYYATNELPIPPPPALIAPPPSPVLSPQFDP